MTAFGPYKETEMIDFAELENYRLFVISGNTGAGKTTIFDGISFALYGSASGTDRESYTMLRSDFADDDTHTAVELEFELNDRVYRILRQLGHVKRGNKTRTGERYEFYEKVDGKEIPCVDRQIVSEIDQKVEEIMGITQEQFKQIVMLPQGEFRKLLTSQTENKEAILRRLFKTEPYQYMSERLKIKKDRVEESFKQEQQVKMSYIQNIHATLPQRSESVLFNILAEEHYNVNQLIAGLENEIGFYEQKKTIDEQTYKQAYETHDQQNAAFHQAKSVNERFAELANREIQLKELHEQKVNFNQKEKQLQNAERASQIEPYEQQKIEWRKEEQIKLKTVEAANVDRKEADDHLVKINQIYEEEKAKKGEREETSKQLDRLNDFHPIVKEIDERKQVLTNLENQTKEDYNVLEQVDKSLKDKHISTESIDQQIKTLDEDVAKLPDIQEKLIKMREQAVVLKDYIALAEKQTKLDDALNKTEHSFQQIKSKYIAVEKVWLHNQASVLAAHLHDGEACPVCGSREHPKKATDEEPEVTRDQLETLKKKLDVEDSAYRTAVANHQVNQQQLKNKAEAVKQFDIQLDSVHSTYDALVEAGKKHKAEEDRLKIARDQLGVLRKKRDQLALEVKELEKEKTKYEQAYHEQSRRFETEKAVFQDRLTKIPEEVRILSELEKKIKETEQEKRRLERNWETAQQHLQQAKEKQTKAVMQLTNTTKQWEETKTKREDAEKQFTEALNGSDFESEDMYQQAKMTVATRQELKQEIEQYKQNLATLKLQVKELQATLKGKTKVDLTSFEERLIELKIAYETAFNQWNQSKEYLRAASTLKINIIQAKIGRA